MVPVALDPLRHKMRPHLEVGLLPRPTAFPLVGDFVDDDNPLLVSDIVEFLRVGIVRAAHGIESKLLDCAEVPPDRVWIRRDADCAKIVVVGLAIKENVPSVYLESALL